MARFRYSTPRARLFAPALALLLPLAAPAAFAQDDDVDDILVDEDEVVETSKKKKRVGLVYLVPVGDADKRLADQVSAGLGKELKENYELVPVSLGGDAKGGAVDTSLGQKQLKKAEKLRKNGEALLKKLRFGGAEKAFTRAIAAYEGAAAALEDIKPVIDSWMGLAEVSARQGEEDKTKEALAAVVRLNPEFNPDPSKYPPLFIRTHAKVRDATMKQGRATLAVDHSGVGADVFIDGRGVGPAPVKVVGLPPGKHYVRVFREDAGLFGAVVEIEEGGEETVSPGFFSESASGPMDLLARNRFSDAAVGKVASAGKAAEVEMVVLGVVGKKRASVPTGLLVVASDGSGAARVDRLDFDGDLLNLSIEALKARETVDKLFADAKFGKVGGDPLLSDVKAGAAVEMNEVAMRYDVKALPKERKSRLIGAEAGDDDDEPVEVDGPIAAGGGRAVLSAGESGSTKTLRDDDEDPLERREKTRSDFVAEEDKPLTEQVWFWPTVIGAGVGGAVVVTGGALLGLVAADILPDPRERTGMSVTVTVAE